MIYLVAIFLAAVISGLTWFLVAEVREHRKLYPPEHRPSRWAWPLRYFAITTRNAIADLIPSQWVPSVEAQRWRDGDFVSYGYQRRSLMRKEVNLTSGHERERVVIDNGHAITYLRPAEHDYPDLEAALTPSKIR
jgi:hypothetical protein